MDPNQYYGGSLDSPHFGSPLGFGASSTPPPDALPDSPTIGNFLDSLLRPAAPDSLQFLDSGGDGPAELVDTDGDGQGQPSVAPELEDTDDDEEDETFEKHKKKCSIDGFLANMVGAEEWLESPSGVDEFRVFGYSQTPEFLASFRPLSTQPSIPASAATDPAPSQPPPESICDKIKFLLRSIKLSRGAVLVQFWAPVETNGQIYLSVLEQPFGVTELYEGLQRYREACIQLTSSVKDIKLLGPPGRVFTRRSSEFCYHVNLYSVEDFPLKNCSKKWGIQGYCAMPLFSLPLGSLPQPCVGVLEFVSFVSGIPWNMSSSIKNKDFVCTRSHCKECKKFHRKSVLPQLLELDYITISPRYLECEVWFPCICASHGSSAEYHKNHHTQLFRAPSFYQERYHKSNSFSFDCQAYFVNNGKSWVGRAYSQNKVCFLRDSSCCSLSDHPYVYFSRALPCFAIPLKLVHPELPSVILEVFLPPEEEEDDEDPKTQLKSLLSEVIQRLSIYHVRFKLQPNMEYWVEFSHYDDDEKYEYFNVYTRIGTMNDRETLGVGRASNFWLHQTPTLEGNVQQSHIDDVSGREEHTRIDNVAGREENSILIHDGNSQDRCQSSIRVSVNAHAQIPMGGARNGQFQLVAGDLECDQPQNPELLGYEREPLPVLINQQQPIAGGTVRGSALIGGETDIANRNNENYDYRYLSITDYDLTDVMGNLQPQLATENLGVEARNTSAGVEVTSDAMEIEPSQVGQADFEGGQAQGNQREEHHFTSSDPTTKQRFCDSTPKAQSKAENHREPYITRKGRQITFDELVPHFGKSREDTLKALKVTKKVFKNIRKHFNIVDWRHTRKKWKDRKRNNEGGSSSKG